MTCAVLTHSMRIATADLRTKYQAIFNSQYTGQFPDGEKFQIYASPRSLRGAVFDRYILLDYGSDARDWPMLREMKEIAWAYEARRGAGK